MRVLVTGGNGFIGSHVIDYLIEQGHTPISFDRYGTPHRQDVEFILGDIRDSVSIDQSMTRVDGVINLAGILGTSETIDRPLLTVQSNMLGAINIFNACKNQKKKGVHITVGNYFMNNSYAITKNAAEEMAILFNMTFGTRIAVVRGLNAYGERQKSKPVRKIVPNVIIPALVNGEVIIYGDGNQLMDMIYVGDLDKILIRALVIQHNCYDKVFEAGNGRELTPTINELVEMIVNKVGSKCKTQHVLMRGGEPERSIVVGDPSTLEPLSWGVKDMVTLDVGISRTIDWYRENLIQFD